MPLRVPGMVHVSMFFCGASILRVAMHDVIHKMSVTYLARQLKKYYNNIVLSRAECFCLCMFVQNMMRCAHSLRKEKVDTYGGKPNG
jgi:hypothetical protein